MEDLKNWDENFYQAAKLAVLGLNETVEIAHWHEKYRFFVVNNELVVDIFPIQKIRWTISGPGRTYCYALATLDNYGQSWYNEGFKVDENKRRWVGGR